jgi:anti-sigma factor RsiW
MKCDRVLELLSDYLDGELSPAAVLGIQSHLRRCEACDAEHEALRRTVQMVSLFGRQSIPIDCRDAVMARLAEEPMPGRVPAKWVADSWAPISNLWSFRMPVMPTWARATALAGLAAFSVSAGTFMFNTNRAPEKSLASSRMQLVRDDRARMRESYQLLQALGRDDGYILAADVVYDRP